MPKKRQRRNPVPKAPPKRRFAGQPVPERQLTSSLARVRAMSAGLNERERPFDPSRAPSWRGSSRDLVVNPGKLDTFTRAFFETALWSTTDNSDDQGGDPLDKNYSVSDIDDGVVVKLAAECERFQEENIDDLLPFDSAENGHNFWLTRCGHGAGFWDGDYPEPQATRLTEASKAFGNVDLYIGDDDVIYAMGYEPNGEQLSFKGMGVGPHAAGGIELREFDWEQVDGDVNLGSHGGIIARSDGSQIDLVEIQPVREYVGDGEAAEVGFPFWIKEASYDLSDLSPSNKEVKAAMQSSDLDLSEIDPEHRGVAIALACMRYGHGSEEAGGGWAGDKKDGEDGEDNLLGSRKVRWGYVGVERKTFAEECGDEDDEFRREVLGTDVEYTYKMAYEVVTPESAEDGEAESNGWEEEGSEVFDSLEDVLNTNDIKGKNWIEWSSSHPDAHSWLISEADQDFRTGADTSYHLWIERADGTPLSQDELQEISRVLGVRMR